MLQVLHAPQWMMNLTLGGFLFAFALGQLLYGPLSDRWGRRPVIMVGMIVYTLASLACALAPTAAFLDVARVAEGLGACAGATVTRAIVRDMATDRHEAASLQSYITVAVSVAPVVAPILGAAILPLGWRSIYAFLALTGIALTGVTAFLVPETLAQRSVAAPLSGYVDFLRLPRSVWLASIIAAIFGGYFSFISGSPFALQHELHLSAAGFSLAFAINALALITGAFTGGRLARRLAPERIFSFGCAGVAIAGVAALLSALHPSVPGFVLTMSAFAFFYALSVPQAYAIGLHDAPKIAGTASATLGSSQQLGGSLGSTVVGMLPFTPALDVGACAIGGGVLAVTLAGIARRTIVPRLR